MGKKQDVDPAIHIAEIRRETATFCVLGMAPLIMENMSAKVRAGLLNPPPKKNSAA